MFLFILGIIVLLAGIGCSFVREMKKWRVYISIACCLVAVIAIGVSCVSYVPTGHTGIMTTFGKVHDEVYDEGLVLHAPWDNIVKMDNREQKIPFSILAFSADIQEVSINGSVNLRIDKPTAMNLYKEVGTDYVNIIAVPRINENVKTVFSNYTAENLIAQREVLSNNIFTALQHDLNNKGLSVTTVSIEDIDFSDAYTNSVEAKQVATQEKLRAQTQQEQQTMEAQQAAERQKIAAQAAAEVQKIQADAEAYAMRVQAEAQANANKALAESITPELIKYNTVSNWNGQLPIFSNTDAMPIINLGDVTDYE